MKPQPWEPGYATERIREIAGRERMVLAYKQHAKEQLVARDIIQSDVLFVLRNGFVFDVAQPSTQPNLFKYRIVSKSPNSDRRELAVVVIPDEAKSILKLITVMWNDEALNRGR